MRLQRPIGFIGLGAMGWPMAARLVDAGHSLVVSDASVSRRELFAAKGGGFAAATPADVAAQAEILITMVPTSAIVEEIICGPDGVLATLPKNSLVIEMSSGSPAMTQKIADVLKNAGSTLIDAPVSGGIERAQNGTLSIMVGGAESDVARAMPRLLEMGTSVTHTGHVGSAHAMKALNNLASAAGFLIGIEVMLIGKKFGLAPSIMVDVLNSSTGMNNSTQKKFKQFVLSRRFNAGFGLDLMVKDLTIALEISEGTATPAAFSELCRDMWISAAASLGPGRDHTEFARYCEQQANTELVS